MDNIDEFRLNSKGRIDKRSTKLYYTQISNFPHGDIKLLDKKMIKKMMKNMNFKDFPDPNFYYIWSYEPEKINLKTRNKEGNVEILSISLASISDQENWKVKQFPLDSKSEKDPAQIEMDHEMEDLYDHKMFKMSIFDKLEYMKNRGDINYEQYTVTSTIARNSKRFRRFRSYEENKVNHTYIPSLKPSRPFKRSNEISELSRNLTKSFAGSIYHVRPPPSPLNIPKFKSLVNPRNVSNKKLINKPSIILSRNGSLEPDYAARNLNYDWKNNENVGKILQFNRKNSRTSEKNYLNINLSESSRKHSHKKKLSKSYNKINDNTETGSQNNQENQVKRILNHP